MDEEKLNQEIEKLRESFNAQKINRIARYSNATSLVILVVLFALFTYGAIRFNSLIKDIEILEGKKQVETLKYASLQFENSTLEKKKSQLEKELMITYGLSIDSILSLSTTKVLEISLLANDAIKGMLKYYKPNDKVAIYYYNKTIDEKRVALELSALGYKFMQRPASEYMSKEGTDAIWFGAGISIDDIKIIALALIRAGVPIKGIRPFKSSSANPGFKRNIIEVGASIDLKEKPLLTVEQIKNAKEFIR